MSNKSDEVGKEHLHVALDQHRAPLFDALTRYTARVKAPLHVPGHKMGRWSDPEWLRLMGQGALSIDLTEAPGLDDLHAPSGAIEEAQALAADLFGASASFFLVGGSTAGLQALILTACKPGDSLAVPRNAHRSVLGAMILAGVTPRWFRMRSHDDLHLQLSLDPDSFQSALAGARAALLVYPSYCGMGFDLGNAVDTAHQAGLPVIVDEAHGTHFGFHPRFPAPALSLGADGTVQSMHKSGGSLTQSSICHLGHAQHIKRERLEAALRLVQSSSPSYLLMASLDVARRHLALNGREAWTLALGLAEQVGSALAEIDGILVHPTDDPTRVVVDVRGRGLTGIEAAQELWRQGVAVELGDWGHLLAILTPGDTEIGARLLVEGVRSLPRRMARPFPPPEPPWPEVVHSPREAYLGEKRPLPLLQSAGRVCAEMICPYPPGIPAIGPGERITPAVVEYLAQAARWGHHLQGPADPTLQSIQVMEE